MSIRRPAMVTEPARTTVWGYSLTLMAAIVTLRQARSITAARDLSVSLCIDADVDDDIYDLSRSDGLGRADHRSWSVFIEEGGSDRYVVPRGMGMVTDRSVSAFMDLAGEDDYAIVPSTGSAVRGNGTVWADQTGGLFLDR
jgi:hypothetical protein